MYAKVKNSTVVKVMTRPEWYTDDGERLSDEQFAEHGIYKLVGTKSANISELEVDGSVFPPVVRKTVVDEEIAVNVDAAHKSAVARIDSEFNIEIAKLNSKYPKAEQETWAVQRAEAIAWLRDQSHPTPFIDTIAAARGMDPKQLRHKVIENVNRYDRIVGELIGKKQRAHLEIRHTGDVEALDSITLLRDDVRTLTKGCS